MTGKDHLGFIYPLFLCGCCENQLIFLLTWGWGLICLAIVDRNAKKDDGVRW